MRSAVLVKALEIISAADAEDKTTSPIGNFACIVARRILSHRQQMHAHAAKYFFQILDFAQAVVNQGLGSVTAEIQVQRLAYPSEELRRHHHFQEKHLAAD